ncbi:methionine synthase [Microlunatus panaciterrae]|uniref:Methionine synthase II (Cobalamin-independent) n=1 Tax=Microlunatus panaciterrae TaxID=400768 RepID=A0ABS2REB0_9ACTN|nr:hypothetical protein [Microlunatus panaciterrae]MBM7797339.1 methionine synthase II (cobalamin-independent) [Microlunatus panaciterrae]
MSEEWTGIRVTGIGSWPGEEMADAVKIAFAECPRLPYLPELPARGVGAQLVGRGAAALSGLAVDLQPAGWRLTGASSGDHLRAKALLRNDLDELEEQAQGYQGLLKYSFAGPWTLAAMMERPQGDRVLADHGARRELGESLAEGIVTLLAEMQRRLPGTQPVLQLDEPLLPSVLAGDIATASGFSRHRRVDRPEVGDSFAAFVTGLERVGVDAALTVHCCARGVPVELLHQSGVVGVGLDLELADSSTWDQLGAAMEGGLWLGAGALSTRGQLNADQVAASVLAPIRRLGLAPEVSSRMVLTPACGLAGLDQPAALRALRTLRTAADIVSDQLAA